MTTETTELLTTLIGSGLGTVLALGICRLFDTVRKKIAEPVAMVGGFLLTVTIFLGLCFTPLWPLCFFHCLIIGGVVWCQRFHPAKFSLTSAALFGILVVELLLVGVIDWLANGVLLPFVVNEIAPHHLRTTAESLFVHFNVSLILVLLLEETIGPWRRRVRP